MQSDVKKEYVYLDNILKEIYANEKNPLSIYTLFNNLYNVEIGFEPNMHFKDKSIQISKDDIFARQEFLKSEFEKLKKAHNYLVQEDLISDSSNEFSLTYKGVIKSFVDEYEKAINYENRVVELENNQKLTNKRMVILTVILTLGTFVSAFYSILQIYAFFCPEPTLVYLK